VTPRPMKRVLWFNFIFSVHIHRNLKIPKRFLLNRGGTDNTMAKSEKKKTDKGANNVHVP
jgi:hypothetical protein